MIDRDRRGCARSHWSRPMPNSVLVRTRPVHHSIWQRHDLVQAPAPGISITPFAHPVLEKPLILCSYMLMKQ